MPEGIVGILLAAGRGSRFGSDKLLYPLADGTSMAVAAASNLLGACERVIAVLRPGSDDLAKQLEQTGCKILFCSKADDGMGHSLAAGVEASCNADGWVLALADMPFISPASYHAVVSELCGGTSLVAAEYQGQRGHPVGFAHKWLKQLLALSGDQGGKSIIQPHQDELHLCPVDDPGVLWDIDKPDDLHLTPAAPLSNALSHRNSLKPL